ncbi:MAG: radical SAM protein, partial [Roseobacter sp.]|nr:radical SAM protein [Roseobacter sp.]
MLDQAQIDMPQALPPSRNTFETVMVDVTHRCNMHCANCYLPNGNIPDMDLDRLHGLLEALPFRTNIRIAGAEPTMRRDLPEIISMVRRTGHRAVLLTNGLRLAKESYVRELKDAGLRHVYVSLNGADNDDWYDAIDQMRCAAKKIAAVENVVGAGMILNTGTIVTHGVNEGAVSRVYNIVNRLAPRHALLRFKTIGALGRYDAAAERQNLSMAELEGLVARVIGCDADALATYDRVKGVSEPNTRLFPADLTARPGT